MEHLSFLHSCCEYCDTVNIQLSNKTYTFYIERIYLTKNSENFTSLLYIYIYISWETIR